MTDTPATKKQPRFNHVAMSLPADALDAEGRADIARFYQEVFGWEEIPQMTENRKRLVLGVYSYNQFVFLIADEPHMTGPRMDHFGMQVDTMTELEDMLARAKAYKEKDDRVDVIDVSSEEYGPITITSFYVGFLLPMMVEVQHFSMQK